VIQMNKKAYIGDQLTHFEDLWSIFRPSGDRGNFDNLL